MSDERPDPDALLRRVTAASAERRRGRLKIFFGASPGVGKTYAMLENARARRAEGADVVIGWLETHGRAETAALAEGLERLPAREVEYRGITLREFDLEAALARRPGLLLLDELAHTNAPGVRHAKRWQDALDLLDAGIDVATTVNVQHVESLNDLVNQITGVTVRETLPDRLLDEADEVEFVDLAADELLKRLAAGKVYVPERAAEARRRFFRRGNLLALRELALRRTADRVDVDVRDYRRDHEIGATWPVAERILVCIRPNPDSGRLVRAARRLAARLKAEWIVAVVESPSQPPLRPEERQALTAALGLAEQLGARTAVLSGDSVSEALLAYARQHNVSKIVVGKPGRALWRDRLAGSIVDQIVRGSGEVDVYFIAGEEDERPRPVSGLARRRHSAPRDYVSALAVVALCTLVCWGVFRTLDKANLVMVYLLGVSYVATRHGRGPAGVAALVSVAAFDFFFVPPHLTFAVSDTQYAITFAVMTMVGLLIATLAVRVRDQAEAARSREQRTQVLYAVSRELAGLREATAVAEVVRRHVEEVLAGSAQVLLASREGQLEPPDPPLDARETAVAQWVLEHGRLAGQGTDTLPASAALYVPLASGEQVMGVLAVSIPPETRPLLPEQMETLVTIAHQAGAALERVRLAGEREEARLAAEREGLRSTLLSSISHDLRTPLAAITGSATTLLGGAALSEEGRRDLALTISEEAEHLNRMVTNLLDLGRLESGALRLQREWHSTEDVVGSALARVDRLLAGREVRVDIPADLPLVQMDAQLIEQVLVNLLENATKYTPPGSPFTISARVSGTVLQVELADQGPGVPPGDEERVFEKYHRGSSSQGGFGLGLPICRAIVSAHEGRIWVEPRAPQGACFRFTLPAGEPPPVQEEAP